MRRRQCKKCPWKKGTDPREIPGDYDVRKHEDLITTIGSGGAQDLLRPLRSMACHESPVGAEQHCVGWLANQLGPGNHLGVRMAVISGQIDGDFDLDGEQHERFEDTLPERA